MMTLTFLSGILFTGAFRCKKENKPQLLPHPTPWNLVLKKKMNVRYLKMLPPTFHLF